MQLKNFASVCIRPRACVCVCVCVRPRASAHRKLNIRTCLDAKNLCVQMRLLFKDFQDVLQEWNPKKPTKLDGNDTTTLSHHSYILCHFANYAQLSSSNIYGITNRLPTSCKRRLSDTTLLLFSMDVAMMNPGSCCKQVRKILISHSRHESGTSTSREPHQHLSWLSGYGSAYEYLDVSCT